MGRRCLMIRIDKRFIQKTILASFIVTSILFYSTLYERWEDTSLQSRFQREKKLEISKRQSNRRERLKNNCHSRSPIELMPANSKITGLPRNVFSHVIVNDRHRFLYCDVPKVATSNWKRVFMILNGDAKSPWEIESRVVHNKSLGYFRYLNEYSPSEIVVRLRTYYKFLFVRNPLERLTSAYRNKFVENYNLTFFQRTYGRYIIRNFRKSSQKSKQVSFVEFIDYILSSNSDVMNAHWQTYDELCMPCLVWYDFIGYFEDLQQDANDVLSILNINDKVLFPRNISSNYEIASSVLMGQYFSQLPRTYVEGLYKKFRLDFEMFGYPRPQFQNEEK